ncbi:MAG: hypothetical protein GY755_00860 [Chloroflexi bacterium]|nr:hypothetical protein [Chloroflexota bacterium]
MPIKEKRFLRFASILLAAALLLIGFARTGQVAFAEKTGEAELEGSPLHPTFPLLDEDGENVLDTGNPVSTIETCGACHDSAFIEKHSYHANAGFDNMVPAGETLTERAWDTSTGLFGSWSPVTYRYLSPAGDEKIDLTTPEWIQVFGSRHPGGGPAFYSQSGEKLSDLAYDKDSFESNIVDPKTGELTQWDWEKSGAVEMNCFLCHITTPDNDARKKALAEGSFQWANTATLVKSEIVKENAGEFEWNADAFNEEKELKEEFLHIQDPSDNNCGLCHGHVHTKIDEPLTIKDISETEERVTLTTGQILSSQRILDSGLNLTDKESLARTWDVHSERRLKCTDCHYALNNPLYQQEGDESQPDHLLFDPRRMELGSYLERPLHQFARGDSAQSMVAPGTKNSMRTCQDCHDAQESHNWLPYVDRHINALSCESCHIPKVYAAAGMQFDWTVITTESQAQIQLRGAEGKDGVNSLINGYTPALLVRENDNGSKTLLPHNLVTTWFWVYGADERPVPLRDLELAYLQGADYTPEILAAFDANANGALDEKELRLDTEEKASLIANRLSAQGLNNPRIIGETQPYGIHHDVATDKWATQDCQVCHSENSILTQETQLSTYTPIGAKTEFTAGSNILVNGEIYTNEVGESYFKPAPAQEGLYVFGSDSVGWVDTVGLVSFIAVVLGVLLHGGLRAYANYKNPGHEIKTEKVYMYTVYERFWHWLQTAAIVILLFTGLVIHNPSKFILFNFKGVVTVHNILAAILALNAAISLIYHLVSGEIKQYIPRPRGFFDQTITQATYYLQGIFKDAEHPFEKTPQKKLNPLQQITYFGILNVFLPLQGITGIFIWGAQRFPDLANSLGGLPFLAPFHTLIAWLFGSFIVMHVYLTTTGHTPLAGIASMIIGWDEVEVHTQPEE